MNRMFMTLFALAFLAPAPTQSQEPPKPQNPSRCSLTPAQAPAIRGIKLGMRAQEILALFPGSSVRPESKYALENSEGYPSYGLARLYFQLSTYQVADKDRFAGINGISVLLFDGRVVELGVNYATRESHPSGPFWPNVDDFIAKLSEAFALPSAADWLRTSDISKILKCSGWEMEASIPTGIGSIQLRSTAYKDVSKERAAADEEKRRREFKP